MTTDDFNGPGYTVNCRCGVILPRKAFFQPCPDAHPVEVTVIQRTSPHVVVVQAEHGTPFHLLTSAGYAICNLAPVAAEHVRLLEVRGG